MPAAGALSSASTVEPSVVEVPFVDNGPIAAKHELPGTASVGGGTGASVGGLVVGTADGVAVGGLVVGLAVGREGGLVVGFIVGSIGGLVVGMADGVAVGLLVVGDGVVGFGVAISSSETVSPN